MTRSRAKAIHDKVNSLLSLHTFDVSVNGSLPHGDTLCMLSYEPPMEPQGDAKEGQEDGQGDAKEGQEDGQGDAREGQEDGREDQEMTKRRAPFGFLSDQIRNSRTKSDLAVKPSGSSRTKSGPIRPAGRNPEFPDQIRLDRETLG